MNILHPLACILFPERCPYCGTVIDIGEIACKSCMKKLDKLQHPILSGASGFRVVSSFTYGGRVRRMILKIKYYERVQFLSQVAQIMAKDIREVYDGIRFDCITFVPMHKKDQRKREFNQSQLLAEHLAELLKIPCETLLIKNKLTKKQHTLKYQQRKNNLNGSFQIVDKELVKGKTILLIDDIVTSGITLGTCCKVLNRAKPQMICCAAIADANHHPAKSAII